MRREEGPYQKAMMLSPDARATEFRLPIQLAGIQAGDRILDCPAGGGYLRRYLNETGIQHRYIPFESKKAYAAFDREMVLGDWLAMPFSDGTFEVVFSIAALHHLIGAREFFYREAHRVLSNSGGRLVIADVARGTISSRWLDGFVSTHSSEGHLADFLDEGAEKSRLAAAGFNIHSYEIAPYSWDFPDIGTARAFMAKLFRIDLATDREMDSAIGDLLGFLPGPGVRIRWELAQVRAEKA
jgi:SAM-dependent methyltransferase